jgi:hypothetical protein
MAIFRCAFASHLFFDTIPTVTTTPIVSSLVNLWLYIPSPIPFFFKQGLHDATVMTAYIGKLVHFGTSLTADTVVDAYRKYNKKCLILLDDDGILTTMHRLLDFGKSSMGQSISC